MAKQTINVGTTANDKKGDSLRAAFQKVNANFTELYVALGLNTNNSLNLGNFKFTNNAISLVNPTNDGSTLSTVLITQPVSVSSDLTVSGDLLPATANGGDLGSSTQPWRSLYVSNQIVFPDGTTQTTAWTGIPGPYADDAAAATAGVAVGYPYHKTGASGQVFVRLS